MSETIRCPDCSTKYRLRPERLHSGIRRLLCFRCQCTFFAEDAVLRVLSQSTSPERPDDLQPAHAKVPPALAPHEHIDDLAAEALKSFVSAPSGEPQVAPAPELIDDLAAEALEKFDFPPTLEEDIGLSVESANSAIQIDLVTDENGSTLGMADLAEGEGAPNAQMAQTDVLAEDFADPGLPIAADEYAQPVEPEEIRIEPEVADDAVAGIPPVAQIAHQTDDLLAEGSADPGFPIVADEYAQPVEPEEIRIEPEVADDAVAGIPPVAQIAHQTDDLLAEDSANSGQPLTMDEFAPQGDFEIVGDDIADIVQDDTSSKIADDSASLSTDESQVEETAGEVESTAPDVSMAADGTSSDDSHVAKKEAIAMSGGTVVLSPRDILAAMASSVSMHKQPEPPPTTPEAQAKPSTTAVPEAIKEDASDIPEDAQAPKEAISEPLPAEEPEAEPEEVKPQETREPVVEKSNNLESVDNIEPADNEVPKFKVKMDDAFVEELTIEDLSVMAEDGRLQDHHLVARQFSDNWIQAPKVPALRPIYDRIRQEKNELLGFSSQPPTEPSGQASPRKGLFSGLFGRN
ncbi:MAG: zinc-ribbon domain-containing protein [Holophagaceae bacterium]|nr:zinc-ribbon domain-containing protein [Holophagaceae bacterium]